MISCSEGNNSLFRCNDDGTLLCLSLFLCFLALFFFLGVSTSILVWSSISEDRGAGSGGVSPFTALTRSWTPGGFEAILGFGTISGSYWVAKGGGGGSGCFGTSGRILLTSDSVFFGTE